MNPAAADHADHEGNILETSTPPERIELAHASRFDRITRTAQRLLGVPLAPAVFMTAKVRANEVASYYKSLGAMGVVAKPFDPMQRAQQVRRLWEQEHA